MRKLIFFVPLFAMGMGIAFAEPLEDVQTSILDYKNNTATVKITWNVDDSVSSYQIGCVSCFPNYVNSTSANSLIINNVTPFPNGPIAMLYGLAYDSQNEIIAAKQIFVNLAQ